MPIEFSLNGSWLFKGFSTQNEEELRVSDPEYDSVGWLSAEVQEQFTLI